VDLEQHGFTSMPTQQKFRLRHGTEHPIQLMLRSSHNLLS